MQQALRLQEMLALLVSMYHDVAGAGAKVGAQGHVREVQSQWRRQRSRLALEVRALLDPLRNPEEVRDGSKSPC